MQPILRHTDIIHIRHRQVRNMFQYPAQQGQDIVCMDILRQVVLQTTQPVHQLE